jgi:hypothetical protein
MRVDERTVRHHLASYFPCNHVTDVTELYEPSGSPKKDRVQQVSNIPRETTMDGQGRICTCYQALQGFPKLL